jgi:hypothetical protein
VRVVAVAAAIVVAASPRAGAVQFLQSRQLDNGGFAERGKADYPQLTAWAVLGLRAAGAYPRAGAAQYLAQHESELRSATDFALVALAETALHQDTDRLLARLRALERPSGAIGALVNGTAWSVLAFRAAGAPVAGKTVRWLLSRQTATGRWRRLE